MRGLCGKVHLPQSIGIGQSMFSHPAYADIAVAAIRPVTGQGEAIPDFKIAHQLQNPAFFRRSVHGRPGLGPAYGNA